MTEKELLIHNKFLDICEIIASFSHCTSIKVGCILVKNNRIISTGYNGTPAGSDNCDDIFVNNFDREIHHAFSEACEIHAEINAIITAARYGISIENSYLYTNIQPCSNCLKTICNSGISKIVYRKKYDKANYSKELINMLNKLHIDLKQIDKVN